jgi:N-acetylmuramoyl-L-alanine amidase
MRKISLVVLHCSDTPDTMDIGVKEIRDWHTAKPPKGRGWRDVGYHYVVRRNGVVEPGRHEDGDQFLEGTEVGAHVSGHNGYTLAVCWVGRDEATMPERQRKALVRILSWLCRRLDVTSDAVMGHRELAPESGKTCPNLDMPRLREELALQLRPAS